MEATEERSSTCQWGGKGATPSPRRRKFWFLPHPLRTFVQRRCFFYYPSRKSARQKPKHKYLGGGGRVCGREEFPRAPLRPGRDRQWVKSGEGGRKKSPPQLSTDQAGVQAECGKGHGSTPSRRQDTALSCPGAAWGGGPASAVLPQTSLI